MTTPKQEAQKVPMTAIREALSAGPTEGPWEAHAKKDPDPSEGTHWISCGLGALGYWRGHKEYHEDCNWVLNEADAKLIAACNPTAIRTLLADLDTLRQDALRYRWLREQIDHGPIALCEEAAGEPYRWSPIAAYCDEYVDAARAAIGGQAPDQPTKDAT